MAVENVQEWVARARDGKGQIKTADSWVLQEGGDILDYSILLMDIQYYS
jgi:hypothetical protein